MTVEETRMIVMGRDVGCVAQKVDPDCGPCYDRWGKHLPLAYNELKWDDGEMDYVRLEAIGPRHMLPEDHVWLCPGHHRGAGPSAGYIWATSHRREERDWLEAEVT